MMKQTENPPKFLTRELERLREIEARYRDIVENANDIIYTHDLEGRYTSLNKAGERLIGYTSEEALSMNLADVVAPEQIDNIRRRIKEKLDGIEQESVYEVEVITRDGRILTLETSSRLIYKNGVPVGIQGIARDISERKRIEEKIFYDAFYDNLTGLANRTLFRDHLQVTIESRPKYRKSIFAVLFLDFDRFKIINDSLGYAEGDNLLKQIAARLTALMRPGDLVARFGGDEFVISLRNLRHETDAIQVVERIQNNLKQPFILGGTEIFISTSVGIAIGSADCHSAEDMLRDADIAMYQAKAKGRARYQVFDRTMHEHVTKQLKLDTEMQHALERKEFELRYQPILELKTRTLVGFEVLVRWNHPERGMIPPLEFIPAAEENNLILPLGHWVLQESCRQLRKWQDNLPSAANLKISVNLSSKQFLQIDLAERIAETLRLNSLDPNCLKLEITESHIMENSRSAIMIMNRLRALGLEFSLDDFGTGYSSLSYLHRLPVSCLKIDRSFISRMIKSRENSEIVHTIIKLAQNLKMKVIAEGIETTEQLARLSKLNCEYGQGYLFAKPLRPETAKMFIEENTKNLTLHNPAAQVKWLQKVKMLHSNFTF